MLQTPGVVLVGAETVRAERYGGVRLPPGREAACSIDCHMGWVPWLKAPPPPPV